MKRFIALLLILSLCAVALAQGPPFRFSQQEETVEAVAPNLSVVTCHLSWKVPPPTDPALPNVWVNFTARYRWQRKNGMLTQEFVGGLFSQRWSGIAEKTIKLNYNFSASDVLKYTMPSDAVACRYRIEIESGIDTPGFLDHRFWQSPLLVQRR